MLLPRVFLLLLYLISTSFLSLFQALYPFYFDVVTSSFPLPLSPRTNPHVACIIFLIRLMVYIFPIFISRPPFFFVLRFSYSLYFLTVFSFFPVLPLCFLIIFFFFNLFTSSFFSHFFSFLSVFLRFFFSLFLLFSSVYKYDNNFELITPCGAWTS